MPFSYRDMISIECTSFKKYTLQKILKNFLKINCKRKRLNMLITKI